MGDLQTLLEKAYAWINGVLEHVLMVIYFMEKHFSFPLKFSVRFWKLVQDGPTYNLLAIISPFGRMFYEDLPPLQEYTANLRCLLKELILYLCKQQLSVISNILKRRLKLFLRGSHPQVLDHHLMWSSLNSTSSSCKNRMGGEVLLISIKT